MDISGIDVSSPRPASGGMRRRTLVRGAAWSVPAIAVATPAPAFAASCNQLYGGEFDWSTDFARSGTSGGSGTITFTNGRTSTVTVSSTFTNYTPTTANMTTTNPVGGTGRAGLTLFHAPNATGTNTGGKPDYFSGSSANNQFVTITFTPAVRNLSFLYTDIDSATGDFIDAIELGGNVPFTSSTLATDVGGVSTVTGTGAAGNPFTQTNPNAPYNNNTGTGGNVKVTYTGSVSSITLRYWNNIASTGVASGVNPDQAMFIGFLSASILNAGCP